MYGMYFDPTYGLVLIGAVICMIASWHVNHTYGIYSQIRSATGMTGAQTAQRIISACGLEGVTVRHVSGELTDHYDPRDKTVNLSDAVYGSASVAAIAVAAHECGHALQHQRSYVPLKIRGALVPVANFGSAIAWPIILIGFFINSRTGSLLIQAGIICFSMAVLFQLVTLPVEFDASHRALRIIEDTGIVGHEEMKLSRKVLVAAALTYVAGAASSILQLLRLILLFGGRDDD
ncbi:MAG: zinc metallopeptidase [Lachnospiraceae bacterium]|nr:zinc metallopeptidase [Lachnospiraceae bacterium]MBQ5430962.1 zinc metallopeptidase [Lachnospiraceae bacterium]